MSNQELLNSLKKACEGHSKDIIRTVVLGVEESIIECEGEFYGDLSEAVIESIHDDSLQSELTENLEYYELWESENFYDVLSCIHDGAIPSQVPEDSGLTQNSTLAELVIYAMKVSV